MCGSAVAEDRRSRVPDGRLYLPPLCSVPALSPYAVEARRLLSYLFMIAKRECISTSVAAFCQVRLERDYCLKGKSESREWFQPRRAERAACFAHSSAEEQIT